MKFFSKLLESKTIFSGQIFDLKLDKLRLPNGKDYTREVVIHPGAVCVAALTPTGQIALVKQYRHALSRDILELPAGKLEQGEAPLSAAKRELEEETGIIGKNFQDLGCIYVSPGYSSEIIHLYFCKAESLGSLKLDEGEFLEPVYIEFKTAIKMVLKNEISDAKTQVSILKLYNLMKEGKLDIEQC